MQAFSGKRALNVELSIKPFSGITMKSLTRDWRPFDALQLQLFNPEDNPLEMTIKITDLEHNRGEHHYDNRFNRSFSLETGWNTLRIPIMEIAEGPKQRQLNLAEISLIEIFSVEPKKIKTIYIDHIKLITADE